MTQYEPYLKISNELIPSIEMNSSFPYLGKDNMHMSNDYIKTRLVSTIEQYVQITNQLPLHPVQKKVELCQRFIFFKLK